MNSTRLSKQSLEYWWIILLTVFLLGYILFPVLKTLHTSLATEEGSYTIIHYFELFSIPAYRTPLIHSIILGVLSVLVCGGIGILLAFLIHFFEFPWKQLMDTLLLLPMVMPGIIIIYAFVQLYGESGMITKGIQIIFGLNNPPLTLSGLSGILVVHAYTQYVFFYITVSIAIRHIDPSVIESARSLGASSLKIFYSILIPFLKPAIIASCAMTFISGAGSFTAPSIIGDDFKVLTTQILLSKANNFMDVAATQVTILTCISLLFFLVFRIYEAKSQFVSSVRGGSFRPIKISNRFLAFTSRSVAVILIITILLPVITIIIVSLTPSRSWMVNYFPTGFTLENYAGIFTSSRKLQPFINSILMALAAGTAGLFIAVPASYAIIKTTTKFKWLIEFLTMLPWAIPCSAIAINLINTFNTPTPLALNTVLVGTSVLLPLGYLIRSLPIMVKTLNISYQSLNDTYLEGSRNLGANALQTFRKISVPILFPAILAAFLLMFIRSIGEYTVSVFLYNASNKPMSIAMVNGIFEYNIGLAMAYGSLLILLTGILSILISNIFSVSLKK